MKTCKRGHIYPENNRQQCPICVVERAVDYRIQKRIHRNKVRAGWRKNNPEQSKKQQALWRAKNPGLKREYYQTYYHKHRGLCIARARSRASNIHQATPSWSDLKAIDEFYSACPRGYEVDHIVPLIHPLVTGLHVLSNLQYLSKKANRSKSNKFEIG